MFIKIFTVLIISFNNIFTIPQNINNDKTTSQLIRNKRQSNETYEFTLSKARINWMWDGFRQNFSIALSEFDKNESGLNKLPIDFKNTLAMKNSYIYLDEEGINTLKTDNLGRNGDLKVTNIKGEIIKTRNFYNWLEFNFQHKKTTDIELPTTTTNFDGNHKYSDVIDNLDYLMVHRGDFDKFNYSYLYWTPVFNFIDTLEKDYYKEFTIKNHGFKNESYFYHKNSTILPNSEIIDPTNATKIEVIKKIKKILNEKINNLAGVNNAIEGIDYNTEIKDNDNNYLDDRATFDLTTNNIADRTFIIKVIATETSTQLQGTNTIKIVIPKQEDTNDNILKIKAFNKTLIAGNNYLQLLHDETEIWKYNTANANDYYLIKYLFGTS